MEALTANNRSLSADLDDAVAQLTTAKQAADRAHRKEESLEKQIRDAYSEVLVGAGALGLGLYLPCSYPADDCSRASGVRAAFESTACTTMSMCWCKPVSWRGRLRDCNHTCFPDCREIMLTCGPRVLCVFWLG